MKKSTYALVRLLLVIVLFAVGGWLCFYNLGVPSISQADESLYVRSAQEMRIHGSHIPTLHGAPFLHKPPLTHYLMYLTTEWLGERNFSYRLVSASAGFFLLLVVFLLGWVLFRSFAVAAVSVAALFASQMLFGSHLVREGVTDGLLVLFTTLALLVGWKLWSELETVEKARASVVTVLALCMGLCITLALLTKSVAGLLPIGIWGVFSLTDLRRVFQRDRTVQLFGSVLVLPLVLFFTLFGILLFLTPGAAHMAVDYEVWEKLFGAGHHHRDRPLYYFRHLFWHGRIFPVTVTTVALGYGIWKSFRDDSRFRYLIVWILLPLFGYTVLQSRLSWYIAPIAPPLAVLIGKFTVDAFAFFVQSVQERQLSRAIGSISLIGYCVVALLLSGYSVVDRIVHHIDKVPLDLFVEELREKKRNHPLRIVFYRVDRARAIYRSLTYRDWYYIDLLLPYEEQVNSKEQLRQLMKDDTPLVIVTASQDRHEPIEQRRPCRHTKIYLDRWRGHDRPKRVNKLIGLVYNCTDQLDWSNRWTLHHRA